MWELDHKETWALKNWCFYWRRLLRVPWTERRSNQSILKEINPEYSLKGLMLKLQYFGHLMQRTDSLEKTVMLGKIEGRRRRWQRSRWLNGISNSMNLNLSKFWEMVMDWEAWRAGVHGVTKSQTRLSELNWTTLNLIKVWSTKLSISSVQLLSRIWLFAMTKVKFRNFPSNSTALTLFCHGIYLLLT